MKKIIFGIFAHPDDEAFGPAGALLAETQAGSELHLITFTAGDAGTNPDSVPDLGALREKEWRAAGKLLGASSMHFLGYKDGHLDNLTMIAATDRITDIVKERLALVPDDTVVEFMSLDLNGYTGHIDHIVVARTACQVFYRLKKEDPRFSRILLACLPRDIAADINTDWIFMEPGRTQDEIDEIVDARHLRGDILNVMNAHDSQRADRDYTIKSQGENLGLNYFIVRS
ncbi:PIG-L family deacetylase [Streptomyces caniscabiei]|uniref:PIG-L deacetylase family protein n=1 Tax=Streptomyces caniscabiei TaxID=2746961 RepID=UPI0029B55B59|nr:PIG-L family deacetylase [Streptomyces caniscabiei]MDX2776329.1 PIG-L family deacetylase [Streptomyces caniscabiei]